jgi:5-methylcytosine-specific restriction endonuclease McrA
VAKRKRDLRYYYEVVKPNLEKMQARNRYRAAVDAADPAGHLARCKKWQESHRELIAAKALAKYRSLSIEERRAIRAKQADNQKIYRAAHRDELVAYAQRYYAENTDAFRAAYRASYAKNKIAYIHRANKRRVLLVGTYTQDDIQRLYVGQRGQCAGCEKDLNEKYEIDHIMPLALDPEGDRLDNLQLLCRACNRSKHAKHPDEWRRRAAKSASV